LKVPDSARGTKDRKSDPHVILAGVVVVLAVIGLTGVIVIRLSGTTPVVIAAVPEAFAAVLAAVPPIIKALRDGR
jgi:hypothetical protein